MLQQTRKLMQRIGLCLVLMLVLAGLTPLSPARAAAGEVTLFDVPAALAPHDIITGPDASLWITGGSELGNLTMFGQLNLHDMYPDGCDYSITIGPDNALWCTDTQSGGSAIARISIQPFFSIVTYTVTAGSYPYGITKGPDGALWYTERDGNKIGRITIDGHYTEYSISADCTYKNACEADYITAGPDGALWFTEKQRNAIGRITTAGAVTEYPLPTNCVDDPYMAPQCNPYDITVGPDGALWFTEFYGGKIGRITTGGVITEYPLPVACDSGGTGTIRRSTNAVVQCNAEGITAGPDGALWFTLVNANSIGRITTGGTITLYPLPPYNGPFGSGALLITSGPDNALWFTRGNFQIGRITTSNSLTIINLGGGYGSPGGIGPSYPGPIVAGTGGTGSCSGSSCSPPSPLPPNPGGPPSSPGGSQSYPPVCDISNGGGCAPGGPHLAQTDYQGALWLTEVNTNQILRIAYTSTITTTVFGSSQAYSVPTTNSQPRDITVGSDGNLWFTEYAGNKIGRFSPTGTVAIQEFTLPAPPAPLTTSGPVNITPGPDGNLWFTESQANRIGRMTTGGKLLGEYAIPTLQSEPVDITPGPDGNLWFTEAAGNEIGRITPDGTITEYPLPGANSKPLGITAGSDHALWFTEATANKIGRITTQGEISEIALATPNSYPFDIAPALDGDIWFTERDTGQVGHIVPPATKTAQKQYMYLPITFRSTPAGW